MSFVIEIENLSKLYRLGLIGTGTLSHDLNRWWHLIRGKEDPYLKIDEVNNRISKEKGNYIWALRGIDLEIRKGDVLGIIGKNGAGKSTLLKILSRITAPTQGIIRYKGRIGSLLEVGTGFHPELTGRENIYLNGAVLGMKKKEISSKFDAIVDFSGCERYINTPVKRYSSGMTVRLGFAVAAFLEPEILIIDEVLAVGDAEFQRKAVGKMKEVSSEEGRTVLFVSHNMNIINSLCKEVLVLDKGKILCSGNPKEMIGRYISVVTQNVGTGIVEEAQIAGDDYCRFVGATITGRDGNIIRYIDLETDFGIEFDFEVRKAVNGVANMNLYTGDGTHILFSSEDEKENFYKPGIYRAVVWIPAGLLNSGLYRVSLYFTSLIPYKIHIDKRDILNFEVFEDIINRNITYSGTITGIIRPVLKWGTFRIK